jgi:hypothetical protein
LAIARFSPLGSTLSNALGYTATRSRPGAGATAMANAGCSAIRSPPEEEGMPYENPGKMLAKFRSQLRSTTEAAFRTREDRPATLSHYTTMKVLREILMSQQIWAVDSRDMKDREELRAAEERIRVVSAAMKPSLPPASRKLFDDFLQMYLRNPISQVGIVAYLSCFTRATDNRAHWDRFAGKGGVCLVLKGIQEDLPEVPHLSRPVRPVMYNATEVDAVIEAGFRGVLNLYEDLPESTRNGHLRKKLIYETTTQLVVVAASAGVFSKREEYRVEEETRYVALAGKEPAPAIHEFFECGVRKQKKYLSLPFRSKGKRLVLEEIVVRGPNAEAAQAEARAILVEAGYTDDPPPVRISSHPFAT